ncbi:lysozyme inhibitor LprI family protein [Fibrella arboris]|uniref:lysozyme inhibitor LprI family protein n=1 Tax=Fibrella arboris TaxID=3242486 RepID=UPI00352209EC
MKRNLIDEITELKARSEFGPFYGYFIRLDKIENAMDVSLTEINYLNEELLKYIPIATIACFEAFFRSVYSELIDFGKPFNENAIKFNQSKNVKFDFDIINAINSKSITIGEFIAHILPCNSFDDINSNITTLIGSDFVNGIKSFQDKNPFDFEEDMYFRNNSGKIIADIKRSFELRHIFCHEYGNDTLVDEQEIKACFNSAKLFLRQTSSFISYQMYPNALFTQAEMNQNSYDEFGKINEELMELVENIKKACIKYSENGMNNRKFNSVISVWKKYRKSKAEFDASFYKGGSIQPLIFSSSQSETTKLMIENLKNEFKDELRKFENTKK